jgi:hypothetical protein
LKEASELGGAVVNVCASRKKTMNRLSWHGMDDVRLVLCGVLCDGPKGKETEKLCQSCSYREEENIPRVDISSFAGTFRRW